MDHGARSGPKGFITLKNKILKKKPKKLNAES